MGFKLKTDRQSADHISDKLITAPQSPLHESCGAKNNYLTSKCFAISQKRVCMN